MPCVWWLLIAAPLTLDCSSLHLKLLLLVCDCCRRLHTVGAVECLLLSGFDSLIVRATFRYSFYSLLVAAAATVAGDDLQVLYCNSYILSITIGLRSFNCSLMPYVCLWSSSFPGEGTCRALIDGAAINSEWSLRILLPHMYSWLSMLAFDVLVMILIVWLMHQGARVQYMCLLAV